MAVPGSRKMTGEEIGKLAVWIVKQNPGELAQRSARQIAEWATEALASQGVGMVSENRVREQLRAHNLPSRSGSANPKQTRAKTTAAIENDLIDLSRALLKFSDLSASTGNERNIEVADEVENLIKHIATREKRLFTDGD